MNGGLTVAEIKAFLRCHTIAPAIFNRSWVLLLREGALPFSGAMFTEKTVQENSRLLPFYWELGEDK
ncbi:MAG: hypothetical protein HRU20_27680 [Pseudomonadales bacterium]|nr:hypothetical protein [Pseudomonadales bacterium]